jgi:hypothetical protein
MHWQYAFGLFQLFQHAILVGLGCCQSQETRIRTVTLQSMNFLISSNVDWLLFHFNQEPVQWWFYWVSQMLALILIFKFPSSLGWRYQYGFAIAEIMDQSDGWQCVSVLVQMQQCNSYWLLASTIETQQIIPWDPGGETHFVDLDKNLSVSTLVHLWQLLSLFLDFAFSAEL